MEGVHERLGQVAAHLMFVDVPFFGVDAGGAGASGGAFEPSGGVEGVALLVEGEGGDEPAEDEGSFGVGEGELAVTEPVGVSVVGELVEHGMDGGGASRVVGRDGASEGREQ